MPDTRVHFYTPEDARELTDFELSPAVHPLVMQKSLENKRQNTIVKGMRRLILQKSEGSDVLRAILGKKELTDGNRRLVEAFDVMSQASFRGKFF